MFVCLHYIKSSFIRNWIIRESWLNGKLKKVKFAVEQATKAQLRSRSVALLFL